MTEVGIACNHSRAMYQVSNESLPAIIRGMDVKPRDRILAICGSGDQALALLEFVGKVVAVDISPDQLALADHRVDVLKKGEYKEMFNLPEDRQVLHCIERSRRRYFSQPGRLGRIAAKLGKLELMGPADILETAKSFPDRTFNKIYLSNVTVAREDVVCFKNKEELLMGLADCLPLRGVIYSSTNTVFYPEDLLSINEKLTVEVRGLEKCYAPDSGMDWKPTVYRKK